jgi:hypothetical protein
VAGRPANSTWHAAVIGATRAADRHLRSESIRRAGIGGRRPYHLALRHVADGLGPVALCFAFALVVILSLSAAPRRSGDAHQYLAMAWQWSQLRPPSLAPEEAFAYQAWLLAQPPESGFPDGARAIRQPALIRDGRQGFSHLSVYPLLAAPATALTTAVGAHPLAAFTITNALLLGVALWSAARTFGSVPALLVIGSPLVWFLARAQVEVFTVALLCLAMTAAARGRWGWAALAVAVASTQNLPVAATIPIFWSAATAEWVAARRRDHRSLVPDWAELRRVLGFALGAVGVALVHPAYSLLSLGVFTPQQLNGGIAGAWPTAGRYFAPLIDSEIGFLVWMPITALLTLIGLVILARSARHAGIENRRLALTALCATAMGVWFLFVFSQTTNVNSGGTVYVSRYVLWLIPLTLPALAVSTRFLEARVPGMMLLGGLALFVVYLGYFHPDQGERYVAHSPQAAWLMTHLPLAYRPLPELFVERTLHIDGGPRVSAADPNCRLLLVLAAWPEQPCALTATERASLQQRFSGGDEAVWVRRDTSGASSVTTAVLGS